MLIRHGVRWFVLSILLTCGSASPGLAQSPSQVGYWAPGGVWPAVSIHTTMLHTGQALFWWHADGAWGTPGYQQTTTYLWDPITDSVEEILDKAESDIFCAGHGSLPDGRFYTIGGHRVALDGIRSFNVYDPILKEWERLPSMTQRRWYPTTKLLPDGRVFVAGGWVSPPSSGSARWGKPKKYAVLAPIPEIFDFESNRWTRLDDAPLLHGNYPFLFVLPDGRLLQAKTEVTRVMDLGRESTWQWEVLTTTQHHNEFGSAAMFRPGKILKAGGGHAHDDAYSASAEAEYLDTTIDPPQWIPTDPMIHARHDHNMTILADGTVMAVGGSRLYNQIIYSVANPEIWDPDTGNWTEMAPMDTAPRMYHSTAILLPDGRVLTSGGNNYASHQVFSPPYLFKGPRPTITSAPDTIVYHSEFTIETPDADSIRRIAFMRPGASTHAFDQSQAYMELPFQVRDGDLDVYTPMTANEAQPGAHMLFLINDAGVPSHAKFMMISGSCLNGIDDDHDGLVDYPEDTGCDGYGDPSERTPEIECDDGIDNDGDGRIDFGAFHALNDSGCTGASDRLEAPLQYDCSDGVDNDGDGLTDFDDPACLSETQAREKLASVRCDDGIDNDHDGFVDYPQDPSCLSLYSNFETSVCSDSTDNDLDGLIDMEDPNCVGPWGDSEAPVAQPSCGLGMELVGLLFFLRVFDRRRSKRSGSG
jgi:hypothetical protein